MKQSQNNNIYKAFVMSVQGLNRCYNILLIIIIIVVVVVRSNLMIHRSHFASQCSLGIKFGRKGRMNQIKIKIK
uniref:Uncharacterized protein n=1 Tax=Anguilla anguilla TaxID=7936 RepID=A0A0E9RX21_ANGAN